MRVSNTFIIPVAVLVSLVFSMGLILSIRESDRRQAMSKAMDEVLARVARLPENDFKACMADSTKCLTDITDDIRNNRDRRRP